MKLPIFKSLLVVATMFQAPMAFSQIKPCRPTLENGFCLINVGPSRPDNGRPDTRPGDGRPDGGNRPGRPDNNGPGRPDNNGPGRPDNNGPGRPDNNGPGRPGGRPDNDGPGRPGNGPGRPGDGPGRPGNGPGGGWPNPGRPNPPSYPAPRPPVYSGEATVSFSQITRASGGEWLRVGFNSAAFVDRVSFEVQSAGLVVHEAFVVTTSGRRYAIREFSRRGVLYAYAKVNSEYISVGERVAAIDLRVESYGGYARMSVTVESNNNRPSIYPYRP